MQTLVTEKVEPPFRLIGSETLDLTPQLAEQFRALTPSPTERDLRPDRVRHLAEKAAAGTLVTFCWSRAKLGDKLYRMNGQHSSTMLCQLNGAFPDGLKVHLDDYQVDSEFGLAALFRQFDDRKSGRSAADVCGAYQGIVRALRGIDKEAVKLGTEGVAWWRRNVEGIPVGSGDDIYRMSIEPGLASFLIWCGELFTIKTPELKRATIAAAAYATFIKSEGDARRFWALTARRGVEFDDTHPASVLDAWLESIKKDPPFGKRRLQPANYYQGCIYCWNAFRSEGGPQAIKDVKYDTRKGLHDAE